MASMLPKFFERVFLDVDRWISLYELKGDEYI